MLEKLPKEIRRKSRGDTGRNPEIFNTQENPTEIFEGIPGKIHERIPDKSLKKKEKSLGRILEKSLKNPRRNLRRYLESKSLQNVETIHG